VGTRTPSRRGVDNFAPLPITVPLSKMRRTPHPNNMPIVAGQSYGVHHTTTPNNAESILRSGKFMPRNHPSKLPLFGYTKGGYFSFERDGRTTKYYREIMQQGKAETVAATLTPRKPLVIRDIQEEGNPPDVYDFRYGTRMAVVDAIRAQLTPEEQTRYDQVIGRAIKRLERSIMERKQLASSEKYAPDKNRWNSMFSDALRDEMQANDNIMQTALDALTSFGYDSLWITQPPSREGGDDLVGGSQVLVLDPSITTVVGIRPPR